MMNKEDNFILYEWNPITKEFWFLGEKIDYVHNPSEWNEYLNNLVTKNKDLQQRIDKAIEYIKENSFYIKSSYGKQIYDDVFKDIENILGGKE